MPAIEIKNLTYIYSKKTPYEKKALDSVNLEIEEGSFVGIVGATGSGKSTLIQHLNGLIKIQDKKKSQIIVNGMNSVDKKTLRKLRFEVGMVSTFCRYGRKRRGVRSEEYETRKGRNRRACEKGYGRRRSRLRNVCRKKPV